MRPPRSSGMKLPKPLPPISRFRRWTTFFARVLLAVLFLAITLGVAAYMFPQQFLTIDSGNVKADALVVLGGGDGRALRGAELYRQGAAPLVIVTGHGDCSSNIGILETNGVPADAIAAE